MRHGEMPIFPTMVIKDEMGNAWHKEAKRQKRLMQGAHLYIPFQCRMCWMRNLERRNPIWDEDDNYLLCIKRANLDAMAGKLPLTIVAHVSETVNVIDNATLLNKTPSFQPRGPFPLGDTVGMGLAISMLIKLLVSRGCIERHVQFSMIKRFQAMYTKNWESSPLGVAEGASFSKGLGWIQPTSCPSQSEWFYNFLQGIEYCMGSQSQPNHGLLIGAIVHLLKLIEMDAQEADEAGSFTVTNKLWKVGTYIFILMVALLCGYKGFYLDLAGLRKHIDKGRTGIILTAIDKQTVLLEEVCRNLPHITICLLGKFKGKTGTDHHLITVANETSSGLRSHWWLERLVEVCELKVRVNGPAFGLADGTLASSTDYDAMFRKYLGIIQ
jgi:hypothetical protein